MEKKIFAELLYNRREMSKANKKDIKIISTIDHQLIDMLKNFKESKEYKIIKTLKLYII